MIALVSGEVAVRRGDHVVVSCGGVGYRLAVSAETLRHVPRVGETGDAAHAPDRARRRAAALRLRHRGGARPVPAADRRPGRRPEDGARRALRRPAARAARPPSRPATSRGCRPCPGSASAPPSGSSSSCARRSAPRPTTTRSSSRGPTTRARSRATACSGSASRRDEVDALLDGAPGDTPEALIAHALKVVAPMIRTPGRRPSTASRRPSVREDDDSEARLRPRRLDEFVGQEALKAQLELSIRAAADRGEALDHVLLAGPPGLGQDLAWPGSSPRSSSVPFIQTAGPALERKARHRGLPDRPRAALGLLRGRDPPAAARGRGDVLSRDGGRPAADHARRRRRARRSSRCDLPPFTLIGATTRAGLLTTPLRDRFGIQHRLDHYGAGRPGGDRRRAAPACSTSPVHLDGARAIAERSRGTPRVANRLLKRVRDYAAGPRRRRDRRRHGRRGAGPAGGRPRGPGPAGPRDPVDRSASASAAARSGSRRSRSRSRRSRTRSRTSTSPTCCSAASSSARRAGGGDAARVPPPRPGAADRRPSLF